MEEGGVMGIEKKKKRTIHELSRWEKEERGKDKKQIDEEGTKKWKEQNHFSLLTLACFIQLIMMGLMVISSWWCLLLQCLWKYLSITLFVELEWCIIR